MGSFREDHMTEVKFKPNVCILLYSAWFSNSVVSNGNCLSLQNPLDCGDGDLLVCSFSTWLCQRIHHQSSGIPGRTTKCGESLCTASGLPFAARKLDYASHSYFVISSFPAMWCWMPWKRLYSVMNAKAVWRNMGGMHESVLYLVWITDRCTVMQVGMPNLLLHVAALVSVHMSFSGTDSIPHQSCLVCIRQHMYRNHIATVKELHLHDHWSTLLRKYH